MPQQASVEIKTSDKEFPVYVFNGYGHGLALSREDALLVAHQIIKLLS